VTVIVLRRMLSVTEWHN